MSKNWIDSEHYVKAKDYLLRSFNAYLKNDELDTYFKKLKKDPVGHSNLHDLIKSTLELRGLSENMNLRMDDFAVGYRWFYSCDAESIEEQANQLIEISLKHKSAWLNFNIQFIRHDLMLDEDAEAIVKSLLGLTVASKEADYLRLIAQLPNQHSQTPNSEPIIQSLNTEPNSKSNSPTPNPDIVSHQSPNLVRVELAMLGLLLSQERIIRGNNLTKINLAKALNLMTGYSEKSFYNDLKGVKDVFEMGTETNIRNVKAELIKIIELIDKELAK